MGKVIVLSGISGSGKSTLAAKLKSENEPALICEADDYFMNNGRYDFNPKDLTQAHASCFKKFIEALEDGYHDLIVVSNTNTLAWEIAPYMLAARAWGYDAEILTLMCPESVATSRNQHGLDARAINNQQNKILRRYLPKTWKETKVEWKANG